MKTRKARFGWRVTGLSLCLGLAAVVRIGLGDDPTEALLSDATPVAKARQSGMPDLVGGLKSVEGCIGVETAQTSSGKQVIFAWFEDRTAAMRWYDSPMHRGVMKSMTDGGPVGKVPMADVPEGVPVLAIASITPADAPRLEGLRMPVSQIAIELYTPLPGGVALGGTFAPRGINVPGLVVVDSELEPTNANAQP